jgi:hypothetical protein
MKDTPQDDWAELFKQIGVAMSRWAGVEHSLCRLFICCFDPDNSNPSQAAFWSVINFEAKLAMVDAVVKSRFEHKAEILKAWTPVRNALSSRAKVRNKIAHGLVVRMSNYKNERGKPDLFLSPYHHAKRALNIVAMWDRLKPNYDSRPKDRMYLRDVTEAIRSFGGAQERVEGICKLTFPVAQHEAEIELRGAIRNLQRQAKGS